MILLDSVVDHIISFDDIIRWYLNLKMHKYVRENIQKSLLFFKYRTIFVTIYESL